MVNRHQGAAYRSAWFAPVLVIALLAFVVLAPSAIGLSYGMDGKWKTDHQFGSPILKLKDRGGYVEGRYSDGPNNPAGEIWGQLEVAGDDHVWKGKFQDDGPNKPKGEFKVRVSNLGNIHTIDNDSFEGWFRACDFDGNCGRKIHWEGEHVS